MMMLRRCFSIYCLFIYLFAGSIFFHVGAMDLLQEQDIEMVMSDCGMMMPVGDDNFSVTDLSVLSVSKHYTTIVDFLCGDQIDRALLVHNQPQAPPDERCLVHGKQTPYFSPSNTTQLL